MRYYNWGKFLLYLILCIIILFAYITVRDRKRNPKTEIKFIPTKKHIQEHTVTTKSIKHPVMVEHKEMEVHPVIKERPAMETHYVIEERPAMEEHSVKEEMKMKYILQWTSSKSVPFIYMDEGQKGFTKRWCKFTNCFVTANENYLDGITKFDVIAFAAPQVFYMTDIMLPIERSPHQKYVFASIESPYYYSVSDNFDGFFNWTWTFKLNSDIRWGYITVRDVKGNVVGPNKDMHWIKKEDMKAVPKELIPILKGKSEAAAWFVSNCFSKNVREELAEDLQNELLKYDLKIDVYGKCGKLKCPRTDDESCGILIEKNYYFYLAFENSMSEDYVTEKILRGLQYSAIPIVYGGANYTRFMPDGSYINAAEFSIQKLAAKMHHLMHHFEEYTAYFKWRNHYFYYRTEESADTNEYCTMCALLNDGEKMKETTVYKNFKHWWNK